MQENDTDVGDRYKYKKVVSILDIGKIQKNSIGTGGWYEYRKTI